MNLNRKNLLIVAPLIFAGIYVFFFQAAYPQWNKFRKLTFEGAHTNGQVIAKEPANHQSIRYDFAVGANHFSGVGNANRGGLQGFDQIGIGDTISVTYLPKQPEISVPGDAAELFHSWSGLLFVILPIFSFVATGFLFWRLLKKLPKS